MKIVHLGIASLTLLMTAGLANAEAIVYTEGFIGTGLLAGNSFTNSLVTLSVTGDTSAVTNPSSGFYALLPVTVSIKVDSLSTTAILTDAGSMFANQAANVVTIGDDTIAFDIVDAIAAEFATYDLTTSIGPIPAQADISPIFFPTDQGGFKVTSVAGDATFTATVVPEPGSLAMFGSGLLLVGLGAFRKSRRPQMGR